MHCIGRYLSIFFFCSCFVTAWGQDAPGVVPEEALRTQEREHAVAKLQKVSKEIGERVARMRALPFKAPVRKGIKSRIELRNYLVDLMKRKQPKERMDVLARSYALVRLLPPKIDLQKLVLDLLQEQVAGFYDPEAKALFLINEWSISQSSIIAHELTHAIQDQHFDLQSLPMEDETREDGANAIRSVIEGEGMLVMMLYLADDKTETGVIEGLMGRGFKMYLEMLDNGQLGAEAFEDDFSSSFGGLEQLASVPLVIRESLIFPYMTGMIFVHKAWKKGGWQGVNALYADMPQSTEQIMHPEKYFDRRDRPTAISFPDTKALAPDGFKNIYRTVMGELYISVLFRDQLKKQARSRWWNGWDGDHYVVHERIESDQRLYTWSTIWDTEQDAKEFVFGFRQLLSRWQGGVKKKEPQQDGTRDSSGNLHQIERRGTEVLIVGGNVPAELLAEAAGKVWKERQLTEAEIIRAKGAKSPE